MFGPNVRKGQPPSVPTKEAFLARFRERFCDPRFDPLRASIDSLAEVAWRNLEDERKAPLTRKAGSRFKNPDVELAVEWLDAHDRIEAAKQSRAGGPIRILLISGSPRNEHTCPGEMPKSFRLAKIAEEAMKANACEVDFLDLSHLASEYGRVIHPCKGCVSTAMPLCNFPCSCYPNYSLAQTNDWMNEIYERWVAAHGVLIITPVHWYQAPSALKLMMDRLVCADGGNPDPTATHGKSAAEAKKLELAGWDFPKHLAGRAFAVITHGDSAGAESLRRSLTDWLRDMELVEAAALDHYIGYYKPYATSHDELDADHHFLKEVENIAVRLVRQTQLIRSGGYSDPGAGIVPTLQK
jgi:multimeric flavodoxin WrbA